MFALFYHDGTVYTGEPEHAPMYGLVCVASKSDQVGTRVAVGDWFAFYDGLWWNHDLAALLTELMRDASRFHCIRQGKYMMPDSEYLALLERARAWRFA